VRPWLGGERSLANLNRFAEERKLRTENGKPVRFVPPGAKDAYYELKVYRTGEVETRPDSLHDFFNALAWLAFPRAKARINAMHAAEMARENGRRGRLRDLLTIFDEGGVIVECADASLISLLEGMRWKDLFWRQRERVREAMRLTIFGHAVMEKALEPWPGIACKALIVHPGADADQAVQAWLGSLQPGASPRDLTPVPVFGYPGWAPQDEAFYGDERYFRPSRPDG
jgi:Protein of unknown function (DUF3025)